MASKIVYAVTRDGKITPCTAKPEDRGKGRCNHIAHQNEGEDLNSFFDRINELIAEEGGESQESPKTLTRTWHMEDLPNYDEIIRKIVSEYGQPKNPDWKKIIEGIKNPFVIGSKSDGSYEEAVMTDFQQTLSEDGNSFKLIAEYEFRGEKYQCDFGEVPVVHPDGTINVNGSRWRFIPVVEQNKAGVCSYENNIIVKQKDGNICLNLPRDPENPYCKIYGENVLISDVEMYLQTGECDGLTSGQKWSLDNMDPIALRRFPELSQNLSQLRDVPPDECNDLTWRKCIRYQDVVQKQFALQMRRMGVTFRGNLKKRQDLEAAGKIVEDPQKRGEMTKEQMEENYPLFYQKNLTENIKGEMIKRSNVQNVDDLNPISALSQVQKISFTGPGGFNKDKAPAMLRYPHESHRGLIDHMDTSSGKNVGLTVGLTGGYIDEEGFIRKKPESECLSPSDFIPYKYHDDPSRGTMAVAHGKQACPIVGGEDPIISTPGWDKIKGSKLGLNLKTAYISHKDLYEDAVFMSQSAAKRMVTVQTQKYGVYDGKALEDLKIGQRLERKDEVGGVGIKYGGIVKSIDKKNGIFEVETAYGMGPGDKVSNRHGGKSVVSRILPDEQMPQIWNEVTKRYEAADIAMDVLSVSNRKNLGQVMECNDAATRLGMKEDLGDQQSNINVQRKGMVLSQGHVVEATCGVQYIMRLNHIAEKKLQSYTDEVGADGELKGGRLGEMEAILLSTDKDRLRILNFLRHQEQRDAHNKLNSLLKAIGVDMTGVNWERRDG